MIFPGVPCKILYEFKVAACVNNTALTINEPDRPGKPADMIPPGEIWFLLGGHLHNGDDVNRDCTVTIRDQANVRTVGIVNALTIASGQFGSFPRSTALTRESRWGYAIPLFPGERIQFYWAAGGASSGGNCNYSYRCIVYRIEDLSNNGIEVESWGYRGA